MGTQNCKHRKEYNFLLGNVTNAVYWIQASIRNSDLLTGKGWSLGKSDKSSSSEPSENVSLLIQDEDIPPG
jgi:hypothetical protein